MDEHRDTDTPIESALDTLARVEPPADHAARVLARSGPATGGAAVHGRWQGLSPLVVAGLRPRWVLPLAATALVVLTATWEVVGRRVALPRPARVHDTANAPNQDEPWGTPRDIVRPVLPPEMYWAMDPLAEFATLRPAPRAASLRAAATGASRASTAASIIGPFDDEARTTEAPAAAMSHLLPIDLHAIMPGPIDVAPLDVPSAITLPEIALEPIQIAPLTEEEHP